ncbi:nicotinate-nucleotide--dimethylbenzimidazole phosphoribosyltransferase [Streptomyces cremeus]|uniref:Nicotinate-nucleotide--dimethylbenzimidazole phosphoribosyltransferase n=2 Tax=Streptomyces cremeus TaxID=66881 RepID=A0ABV5PN09_STRCM
MTDTGQVPGEGLPENAGMVEQPGVPAPGAYTFLDPSDPAAQHSGDTGDAGMDDDDVLLMPAAQGAWSDPQVVPAQPPLPPQPETGAHEAGGRDSGSVDLSGVRMPPPPVSMTPPPARRPLHLGPPVPDTSGGVVRSLADRGPAAAAQSPQTTTQAAAPVPGQAPAPAAAPAPGRLAAPAAAAQARHAGPPTARPEYLDIPGEEAALLPGPQLGVIPSQGPTPWAQPQAAQPGAQQVQTASVPVPAQGVPADGAAVAAGVPAQAEEARTHVQVPETAAPVQDVAGAETAEAQPYQEPQGGAAETVVPEQSAPEAVVPEAPETSEVPATTEAPALAAPTPAAAAPAAPAPAAVPAEELPAPEAAADAPSPVVEPGPEQAMPTAPVPAQGVPQGEFVQAEGSVPDGTHLAPTPPAVPVVVAAAEAPAPDVPVGETPAEAAPVQETPAVVQETPAQVAPTPDVQTDATPEEGTPANGTPVDGPPAAPEQAVTTPEPPMAPEQTQAAVPVEPPADAPPQHAPEPPSAPAAEAGTEPVAVPQEAEPSAEAEVPTPADQPVVVPAEQPGEAPAPLAVVPAEQPDDVPAQPGDVPAEQPGEASAQLADAPAEQSADVSTEQPATPAEHPADAPAQPADVPAEQSVTVPAPRDGGPVAQSAAQSVPADPEVLAAGDAQPQPVPAEQALSVADEPVAAQPQSAPAEPTGTTPEPVPAERRPEPAPQPEVAAPASDAVQAVPSVPQEVPSVPQESVPPRPVPQPEPVQPAQSIQEESVLSVQPEPTAHAGPEAPQTPQAPAQEAAPAADVPEGPQVIETAEVPEPAAAPATPPAPGYDDAEREAVLRVMRERRDIRNGFRSDPIPHEVLLRVLEAAHTAPSVGHSQPWDFVVIRSAETRRAMHELASRQRDAYAKSLPKARAKQFKELKIEAILDTPVNIVVTADPTRGGRHTLGRHTQPQMAPYSSALAVENLWLAARAEGLGVGWVSFFDEREMVRALGLPEHLEVVAYLCVGYVDEFPEEPELLQAGWSKRRPLSWVVHEETYGRRALPGEEPHDLLQETVSNIRPLDAKALGEAWERQKRMTKPAGALGMLEIISAQLSGLARVCPPPIPEPAAVAIFAGDHGVHAQGVTAWPQEVTSQMVANFLGGGAVCNAFANQVGAEVCVIDVGVAGDLPATPGLLPRKVRAGTADFTTGPALSREDVLAAIEVGIETARDLVAAGNKALLTGEMGIANTTVSAALICVYTGQDPAEVTGRGTGINDEMHARKVDVVRRALDLHKPEPADPVGVLSAVGGLEHAALVGFILGGASLRVPVLLDGVSAGAAALVARAVAPEALAACIAGHRSAEPGHVAALNKLGLRPLVDLDLRLGEGTGALLALPVVQSAARAMHEVATFDSAGVTEK